jgi:adenylate cyclase
VGLPHRPTGDVVNTASRVERFNKYLGTQITVTDKVIRGLDGLVTRELGTFRIKGTAKALVLHELQGRTEEADEVQRQMCTIFAEGLAAFRKQLWNEARAKFQERLTLMEKDGPSSFYLPLCDQYAKNSPQEWDPVVTLEKK